MNGIGNAFIWTAIACGPLFMLIIGIMAIVPRKARRAAPAPVPARQAKDRVRP